MSSFIRRWQDQSLRLEDSEQSFAVTYTIPGLDFGTANGAFEINGPPGKVGQVVDIRAHTVTETFACDTTPGNIIIGTAADPNAYVASVADGIPDGFAAGTDDVQMGVITPGVSGGLVAADTAIDVTPVVGVDAGAEAGICSVSITILWT